MGASVGGNFSAGTGPGFGGVAAPGAGPLGMRRAIFSAGAGAFFSGSRALGGTGTLGGVGTILGAAGREGWVPPSQGMAGSYWREVDQDHPSAAERLLAIFSPLDPLGLAPSSGRLSQQAPFFAPLPFLLLIAAAPGSAGSAPRSHCRHSANAQVQLTHLRSDKSIQRDLPRDQSE